MSVYEQSLKHYRKFYAELDMETVRIAERKLLAVKQNFEPERRASRSKSTTGKYMWLLGRAVALQERRQALQQQTVAPTQERMY